MNTINYSALPNSKVTPSGQIVWSASDLLLVMDYVKEHGWIILGGDVLTCSGNYTYDNWYYSPQQFLDLAQNIDQSITVCLNYVDEYTKRNGNDFLFSLTLSNSFLNGNTRGGSAVL